MCGIVGYVGKLQAAPILLEGLRRLEYRGYDSAGLSVLKGTELQTRKKKGKIDQGLAPLLQALPAAGQLGIGHTRWATHGSPLIIGVGEGENFLASDAAAIVAHTRQVVYLNDYDVATLTPMRFDVENLGTGTASFQISQVEFSAEAAERGKFPHYMLKEIF